MNRLLLSTTIVALGLSSTQAQDTVIADDLVAAAKTQKESTDGWQKSLSVAFTGSYNRSDNVVGSTDGATMQLGLALDGGATLVSNSYEWENSLKLQHTQSRTPVIEQFVKSLDNLSIQSTYLHHMSSPDWLGPFARFTLSASVLDGYEVRADDTTVRYVPLEGAEEIVAVAAEDRIELTSGFEPMILNQTLGIYANPVTEENFTLDGKAGLGLQQIVVSGGYAILDDGSTPELELKELEGANEVGAEFELAMSGQPEENLKWTALAHFFYPFASSSDTEFSGLDVMNTNLQGALSLKLGTKASLDYVLNIKRVPLVLDDWQIQNGLMLTAGFDLF